MILAKSQNSGKIHCPQMFSVGTPMVTLNNEHDGLQVRHNELA